MCITKTCQPRRPRSTDEWKLNVVWVFGGRHRDGESSVDEVWRNVTFLLNQRDPRRSHAATREKLYETHRSIKDARGKNWLGVLSYQKLLLCASLLRWCVEHGALITTILPFIALSTVRRQRSSPGLRSRWQRPGAAKMLTRAKPFWLRCSTCWAKVHTRQWSRWENDKYA